MSSTVYVTGHADSFDATKTKGLDTAPEGRPVALVRTFPMTKRGVVWGWYRSERDASRAARGYLSREQVR